jgi:hypothetical protein
MPSAILLALHVQRWHVSGRRGQRLRTRDGLPMVRIGVLSIAFGAGTAVSTGSGHHGGVRPGRGGGDVDELAVVA